MNEYLFSASFFSIRQSTPVGSIQTGHEVIVSPNRDRHTPANNKVIEKENLQVIVIAQSKYEIRFMKFIGFSFLFDLFFCYSSLTNEFLVDLHSYFL
jgi:Casein kinase 1 gamma C terminal